jgi:2-(3-amino-3-carboxypropyl)histidine synthase
MSMTKKLFIHGRYAKKIIIPTKIINKLPGKLMLFSSVQFIHQLKDIKAQLKKRGKDIVSRRSRNFLYNGMESDEGVLLGCNTENYEKPIFILGQKTGNYDSKKNKVNTANFDAFLYIGDGLFHPKALLLNNRKDIYCYDPKSSSLNIITKDQHDLVMKKKMGSIALFLSSKIVGILISQKPGQDQTERARALGKDIIKRWPDKEIFFFIADSIDFSELENFNFIDIYINTACPRIGYDDVTRSPKPIINMSNINELINDSILKEYEHK